jgi:hypothetical protein
LPVFCRSLCCSRQDLIAHFIEIRPHAIIFEADHLEAEPAQLVCTGDIIFTALMLNAVNFDDQLRLKAHKVADKAPDRMLPPETEAADLTLAETPPESSLYAHGFAAHRARGRP